MAENTFMGVPRSKIPWAPSIDYEKCDFCMDCDEFCPHRVFERRDGDVKLVVGIGPVPMMKFVSKMTADYGVKTLVSLNAIMVDGTGMCGCCRVSVGGKTRFACVDGPEFDGHLVNFEELQQRLDAYKAEEKESLDNYACRCSVP